MKLINLPPQISGLLMWGGEIWTVETLTAQRLGVITLDTAVEAYESCRGNSRKGRVPLCAFCSGLPFVIFGVLGTLFTP